MTDLLLDERGMRFQLYELLDTQAVLHRRCYAEHHRAVFDAIVSAA